jgi:hypothetical protein
MIDPAIAALLGAAIGAGAGNSGGIVLEAYKRRRPARDRVGVSRRNLSILYRVDRRNYVAFFEEMLPRIGAGENVPIGNFAPGADHRDPVLEAFIDRLGLLPERVVRFYSMVAGIRWNGWRNASSTSSAKGSSLEKI